MMLDNVSFDKIKLLYKLSDLLWFIEKHALLDAQNAGDKECVDALVGIQRDFQKHIEKLQKSMCIISQ
jgi:hypothetical protein